MRPGRRVAAVIILGLSSALLVSLRDATLTSEDAVGHQAVGAPGSGSESARGSLSPAMLKPRDLALARAYAAVGLAADGDSSKLEALDVDARARVEEARGLLDLTPRSERAIPGSAGTSADHPSREHPSRPVPGVAVERSTGTEGPGSDARAMATASPVAVVDAHVEFDFSKAVDPARAVRDTADGPVLLLPGLWSKVAFLPWHRARLVIADRSARTGGGYAVAFYGNDFSTIRLDGGMVVPGRYYQVRGDAVITGAAPASIDIRPLDAVPSYHPRPLVIPEGNG